MERKIVEVEVAPGMVIRSVPGSPVDGGAAIKSQISEIVRRALEEASAATPAADVDHRLTRPPQLYR